MIYLQEILNLSPASPENVDNFVKIAQEELVPACERLGTRILVAWFSNVEWFGQITQVFEFENMDALKNFRIKSSQDKKWGEYLAKLDEIAPERHIQLLESLGSIPQSKTNKHIEECKTKPFNSLGIAILEVFDGKMESIKQMIANMGENSPIIASWRPISGHPTEIIDVWRGDQFPPETKYTPVNELSKQFFRPLRLNAPKERFQKVITLPYGLLR